MNRRKQSSDFRSIFLLVCAAVVGLLPATASRAQEVSAFETANYAAPMAIYTVTTTNDFGAGSLRQAITDANASAGADEIRFNIAPHDGTVKTINVTSALPAITDPVTIDGYTQPQTAANTLATGSNAVLLIELVGGGTSGGSAYSGISIAAGNSTVRGLVLRNFSSAILLETGGGNRIEGNRVGTNAAGTSAASNFYGVNILGSAANQIGGVLPAQRNLFSANNGNGIRIFLGSTGNIVENNYVGTNASGTAALGNGSNFFLNAGIEVYGSNHRIGGTSAGAGNLISGNDNFGIFLRGASNTTIEGNRIGTNASGTAAVPNIDGIEVGEGANNNTIGGTAANAGNLISGNSRDGIAVFVFENGEARIKIQGNFVGVAADGTTALGNGSNGIRGRFVASIIGAETSGAAGGNIIANNSAAGVAIVTDAFNPTIYFGARVLSNKIYNNRGIGIDLSPGENPNGATANDANDVDQGGNNLQNFPVLASASTNTSTRVTGSLSSAANRQYLVEFFATASGSLAEAEGQTLLGSRTYTTNASGIVNFDETFPVNTAGQFITATATDLTTFDTSEFTSTALAPTAAAATVSGRIVTASRRGIGGVRVTLTDGENMTRSVTSNPFGYYRFADVDAGQTYLVSARAKRYSFAEPTRVFSALENVADVNFIALP